MDFNKRMVLDGLDFENALQYMYLFPASISHLHITTMLSQNPNLLSTLMDYPVALFRQHEETRRREAQVSLTIFLALFLSKTAIPIILKWLF